MTDVPITEIARLSEKVGELKGSMLTKNDLQSLSEEMKVGFAGLVKSLDARYDALEKRLIEEVDKGSVIHKQQESRLTTSELAIASVATTQSVHTTNLDRITHHLFGNGTAGFDEILRNVEKRVNTLESVVEKRVEELEKAQKRNDRLFTTMDIILTPLFKHGEWIVTAFGVLFTSYTVLQEYLVNQAKRDEVLLSLMLGAGFTLIVVTTIIITKLVNKRGKSTDSNANPA